MFTLITCHLLSVFISSTIVPGDKAITSLSLYTFVPALTSFTPSVSFTNIINNEDGAV